MNCYTEKETLDGGLIKYRLFLEGIGPEEFITAVGDMDDSGCLFVSTEPLVQDEPNFPANFPTGAAGPNDSFVCIGNTVGGEIKTPGFRNIVGNTWNQAGEGYFKMPAGSHMGTNMIGQFVLPADAQWSYKAAARIRVSKGVGRTLPFHFQELSGPVAGDTNGDGIVNWQDLTLVLSKWEQYGFDELTKILSGYN